MTRDVPFDEEVAERDPETQESFADVRPLGEVEAMRVRWAALFGDASREQVIEAMRENLRKA